MPSPLDGDEILDKVPSDRDQWPDKVSELKSENIDARVAIAQIQTFVRQAPYLYAIIVQHLRQIEAYKAETQDSVLGHLSTLETNPDGNPDLAKLKTTLAELIDPTTGLPLHIDHLIQLLGDITKAQIATQQTIAQQRKVEMNEVTLPPVSDQLPKIPHPEMASRAGGLDWTIAPNFTAMGLTPDVFTELYKLDLTKLIKSNGLCEFDFNKNEIINIFYSNINQQVRVKLSDFNFSVEMSVIILIQKYFDKKYSEIIADIVKVVSAHEIHSREFVVSNWVTGWFFGTPNKHKNLVKSARKNSVIEKINFTSSRELIIITFWEDNKNNKKNLSFEIKRLPLSNKKNTTYQDFLMRLSQCFS